MLILVSAKLPHCLAARRQRVIPFLLNPFILDAITECLRYQSAKLWCLPTPSALSNCAMVFTFGWQNYNSLGLEEVIIFIIQML